MAFPGAEGFGSATRAGRGGRILRVTSLADSGPGTFRQAVSAGGPRIVVFEVGGIIHLKNKIVITEPYLTIAGQTAPSPGITLYGDMLRFNTHDVLVQHLRIRGGDENGGGHTPPKSRDSFNASTDSDGKPYVYNIFADHCSISWSLDENVSLWYPNVYDVTIRNSIISEALLYQGETPPGQPNDCYSFGMIVGNGQRRVASIQNLFAHNGGRNPRFSADSTGMVVNNVIYNICNSAVMMGSEADAPGPIWLRVEGNVYLPGPSSRQIRRIVMAENGHPRTRLFVVDNIGPYSSDDPWSVVDSRVGDKIRVDVPPVTVAPFTILPSEKALGHVLRRSGARPSDRDAVDRRIVNDVSSGRGRVIRSPKQVGGLPRMRATQRRLHPPQNVKADQDGDGYTDVEEWLHCLARKVEGSSSSLTDTCPGPREGVRPLGNGGS